MQVEEWIVKNQVLWRNWLIDFNQFLIQKLSALLYRSVQG